VVLEKTLESPLDCKEIQPVHPKGNWSWVFIGRTDLKLKLQYFEMQLRVGLVARVTNLVIRRLEFSSHPLISWEGRGTGD